ncbi:unnamed protein product [Boreogadus saida]
MKALIGLLLLVFGHGVSSVLHSLHYFYTGSSGLSTFPEFVGVGMVDGVQMVHYDSVSKSAVPKHDAADQIYRDHPGELERNTGNFLGYQQAFKASIVNVKKIFNQTGGIHIYQRMYGCEWDDEDNSTDGYEQYGYDGEDFISLDLETLTWVAAVPQAVSTKQRWDGNRAYNELQKNYLTKFCVGWLKKYLAYGKSTLQRTGFYPDRVVVFWRRDGQELHEQVDPGEVLPNHDGTFQVSVDLDLKAVPQEDWGRYECVVQLKGIEDISTPLDPALIRTNSAATSRSSTVDVVFGGNDNAEAYSGATSAVSHGARDWDTSLGVIIIIWDVRDWQADPEKHKVCLYEVGEFKGRKMEIMDDDVPSLFSYGFTDRVGSVMVSCGTGTSTDTNHVQPSEDPEEGQTPPQKECLHPAPALQSSPHIVQLL